MSNKSLNVVMKGVPVEEVKTESTTIEVDESRVDIPEESTAPTEVSFDSLFPADAGFSYEVVSEE